MNYLMEISYDGSKFYGFQRLNNYETVQKKIDTEPMNNCTEKHKKMPDKMGAFFLHCKRNDSKRVQDASGYDKEKQRQVAVHHFRDKNQTAPPKHNVQGHMNLSCLFRPEDTDQRNAGQNQEPFSNAEGNPGCAVPE